MAASSADAHCLLAGTACNIISFNKELQANGVCALPMTIANSKIFPCEYLTFMCICNSLQSSEENPHLHVHLLHQVAKCQRLPISGHCCARPLLVMHVYRAFLQLLQPELPALAQLQTLTTSSPVLKRLWGSLPPKRACEPVQQCTLFELHGPPFDVHQTMKLQTYSDSLLGRSWEHTRRRI